MTRSTRRRGFATVLAIVLIGIVGSAIGAMATYFAFQSRRTNAEPHAAQQRQLLLAAAQLAPRLAAVNVTGMTSIPTPLENCTLQITLTVSGSRATAEVAATENGTRVHQTLTLEKSATAWQLISAE